MTYTMPLSWYQAADVVSLARSLLGKVLVTERDGNYTSGLIVETEAYAGVTDKASHAYGGRQTARTSTMYLSGGHAYVYLIYGMYYLFNVVTGPPGTPHAVLIRATEPIDGVDIQLARRGMHRLHPNLSAGPGRLTLALGIGKADNGLLLNRQEVRIEDRGITLTDSDIASGPRIGVGYAADHALWPYRFWWNQHGWVSKGR